MSDPITKDDIRMLESMARYFRDIDDSPLAASDIRELIGKLKEYVR